MTKADPFIPPPAPSAMSQATNGDVSPPVKFDFPLLYDNGDGAQEEMFLGHEIDFSDEPHRDETENGRASWTGRMDFLMSLIAYAVGLGNVWRFPYLCFKNGGGAFLIPYVICWCTAAVPIFFLEVSVGQFLQRGGVAVWKICPLFKGVGIANIIMACLSNLYYCVIVAWALFYLFASLTSTLPWVSCDNGWNDENCQLTYHNRSLNLSELLDSNLTTLNTEDQTPVEQFWENHVLQTSNGIGEIGNINWRLCLLLLFAWTLVYFALWKGITQARKFVYVCALMPYVFLIILLIRGITLEGALQGIQFYLKPNMSVLLTTTVWKDAGTQVFYSYGIGFGALVALGSYNPYHHNCHVDAMALCVVNAFTSCLAGFVVFCVLGHLAFIAHKEVKDVVKSGVGLAFLVYPELVSFLPLAPVWSALFFTIIAILGMDSQVCTVEGVVTVFFDAFPRLIRKEVAVALLCICNFFFGLILVTQGGQYWLTLIDFYAASGINLLLVVFMEVVGFAYGFGAEKMMTALEDMIGYRPSQLWVYAWKFTAPATCMILFSLVVMFYEPLEYSPGRPYPVWAQVIGHFLSFASILAILIYAIYAVYIAKGRTLKQKLRNSIRPITPARKKSSKSYGDAQYALTVLGSAPLTNNHANNILPDMQ